MVEETFNVYTRPNEGDDICQCAVEGIELGYHTNSEIFMRRFGEPCAKYRVTIKVERIEEDA